MNQYQYFLVSLVPDPLRNEQINIGIIGLFKDRIFPLFLKNNQKIQSIAPNYDTTQLPGEGIVKLISTVPAPQRNEFLSNLSDEFVRISPPATGLTKSYNDFEVAISQIFDGLVKPVARRTTRVKITALKTKIKDAFNKKGFLGKKIDDKKIVSDFVIAPSENLVADFAYRNGVFNLVETIDYRVSLKRITGDKFKETALAAIKIDETRRKIDKKAKGRLLFIPPEQDNNTIMPHQSLLSDYYDNIYNCANRDELSKFYSDIEKDFSNTLL